VPNQQLTGGKAAPRNLQIFYRTEADFQAILTYFAELEAPSEPNFDDFRLLLTSLDSAQNRQNRLTSL
jgi:hypothetical protein